MTTEVKVIGLYLNDLTFTTQETRPAQIKEAAKRKWFGYWRGKTIEASNLKPHMGWHPKRSDRGKVICAIKEIQWKDGPSSPKIESIGGHLAGPGGLLKKPLSVGSGLILPQQTQSKTTRPSDD